MSIYPNAIDGYEQLPLTIDGVTEINAFSVNVLREAILNIESELGTLPSADFDTVSERIDSLEEQIDSILFSPTSITVGSFSDTPSSPNTGDLQVSDDSAIWQRYNGASWDALLPGRIPGICTIPQVSNLTWENQGTATASNSTGPLVFTIPTSAGTNFRLLTDDFTGTTRLTAYVDGFLGGSMGVNGVGGLVLQSGTGGPFLALYNFSTSVRVGRFDHVNSFNNTEKTIDGPVMPVNWLRVRYNATTGDLEFYTSGNGINWHLIYSENESDFLGATPDRIGYIIFNGNDTEADMVVYHGLQESA